MKILTKKKQKQISEQIKELNSLIVNSNIDLEAYDLLADISNSILEFKYLYEIANDVIEEYAKSGTKKELL